ncbi:PfkB family carbohydrate kinase [Arthrobacter mangrovi]|uniref:Fructosamine kinase FrlD n=1 Tax=Arthrobacter mangrovi TaxID=2966350 RepID=A0ABQ5MPT7_9MICC|nr:PfkB family carbohydrate kinase [Arthrobacter mangrovi]GLB65956.1 fructosamine kinase FrlD [Arthrobacter mangrovi]
MKVLGFGDNIIDRFNDRRVVYPGGNCVNFAVFARKLGLDADYLGVFGNDDYADLLRGAIALEGVGTPHCVIREGPSGISNLTVVDGERVFGGWNGGGVTVSEPLTLDPALLAYAAEFALTHSSVYSRSEHDLPALHGLGRLVSYDFSSEDDFRTHGYLSRVCPSIDLALFSCSHLSVTETTALLEKAVRLGARMALGTRGTAGSILWDGRNLLAGSCEPVDEEAIVDTMGCGDAYLAAFVAAMLWAGWTREELPSAAQRAECLTSAASFAARQTLVDGAFGHGQPVGDGATTRM